MTKISKLQVQLFLCVVFCFVVIVAVLAEENRWDACKIHACVSFANPTFQLYIISICFFPGPLYIVPTYGAGWGGLFLCPTTFLLFLVTTEDGGCDKLIPNWFFIIWIANLHQNTRYGSSVTPCGSPFSTPNILESNWITMTAVGCWHHQPNDLYNCEMILAWCIWRYSTPHQCTIPVAFWGQFVVVMYFPTDRLQQ